MELYRLVPAAPAQIFNPIAELIIPIGIPIKEVKAAIEIHPLMEKLKKRTCSI